VIWFIWIIAIIGFLFGNYKDKIIEFAIFLVLIKIAYQLGVF
jgi:hypothetical protein